MSSIAALLLLACLWADPGPAPLPSLSAGHALSVEGLAKGDGGKKKKDEEKEEDFALKARSAPARFDC